MTQVKSELFTDLTQEQCQTVEGGLFVLISGIQALKAGADLIGKDETYIKVDGQKIWGPEKMGTGQFRSVNRGLDVGSTGKVDLFDEDVFRDDYMGGFTVSSPTNDGNAIVSGSGSRYRVFYKAFA